MSLTYMSHSWLSQIHYYYKQIRKLIRDDMLNNSEGFRFIPDIAHFLN